MFSVFSVLVILSQQAQYRSLNTGTPKMVLQTSLTLIAPDFFLFFSLLIQEGVYWKAKDK